MMLKAPFPYYGGKSQVADIVWAALGDVYNYVEPFCGSCAVYLARPGPHKVATLNDKDGLIVNFWRAIQHAPEEVARWAAWPVSECDLHARHAYIVRKIYQPLEGDPEGRTEFVARLEGDPDWYDARIAGYWVYGMSSWIGSGFCSGKGTWAVNEEGILVHAKSRQGIHRKRPHLESQKGINRQLLHLANTGKGINRQLLCITNPTDGTIFNQARIEALIAYFNQLAEALAVARITCGDWKRVCGPSPTWHLGLTGMFLDPPYSHPERSDEIYLEDSFDIAKEVREYCLEVGNRKDIRIVLAGYEGEGHEELEKHGWRIYAWKAGGSYTRKDSQNQINRRRERLWFSPHCLGVGTLF